MEVLAGRERGGGGLHYISAALAPTQSNVASESKLPDEMDRFFFNKTVPILHKSSTNLKQIHNDNLYDFNYDARALSKISFF